MSYEMCLEKAGAKVIDFRQFGDYQGSWYAFVEYNGERGWVQGSYGSCSGCDAFEAEFEDAYYSEENFDERYAEFGRSYLEVVMPQAQQLVIMEAEMGTEDDWYHDEYKEIYNWMKEVGKE